jgi:hypothetical protein
MTTPNKKLTFTGLVDSIKEVDLQLMQQASKAVNVSPTLWKWLIGIVEAAPQLRIDGKTLISKLSLPVLWNCLPWRTPSRESSTRWYRKMRYHESIY